MSKLRNLSKSKRNLVRESIKGFDFDWAYLLRLEKIKLENMYAYFNESRLTADWWQVCRQIKWCINLLDIILEDAIEYTGYVNHRNSSRFLLGSFNSKIVGNALIRNEKAWHLYNLIRLRYLRHWWD